MGDVDHRHAVCPQLAHDAKQVVGVLLRERRRWLVENEHARFRAQCARDLDELLLRHAELSGIRLRIDARANLREKLRGTTMTLSPINPARRVGALRAERDVLGDRQLGEQRWLLIDGRDAERLRQSWGELR